MQRRHGVAQSGRLTEVGARMVADGQGNPATLPARLSTGIQGLDEVLSGGLPQGQIYLVEGESGAGKTTLGLQFLLAGQRRGERTLWITLSETERQLRQTAQSHGWSLDGTEVCNPVAPEGIGQGNDKYSFFSPADVELEQIRQAIVAATERVRPSRVVFDPFSDVRHLAREILHYRRQVLSLREFFNEHGCTVLLMQELTRGTTGDLQAEALVHGYLTLHQDAPEYGGQRRRLRVHKMRGMAFRDGFHDFSIQTGGIEVYPRLIPAQHVEDHAEENVASDVVQLDALLGGGVDRGSSMLIMGAAGVGKSTLATQYAVAGARRGEKAVMFIFDETAWTYRARAEKLGFPIAALLADGTLTLRQIDTAEVSSGQFTNMVMQAVDGGVRTVVIDSLTGYLNTMPEERFLVAYLHELLTTLSQRNVLTILTVAQHGLVGQQVAAPFDVSYLSDTVLLIRYFEAFGEIRRAISVVKKRSGPHEIAVREMRIDQGGVTIGDPIRDFQGVLSGVPQFTGDAGQLGVRG
jgi:circadian clock protein KaiC